ncbi:MAG: calcium/sodium antiporter [Rhodospirillaceae bacterium]|nr:calcium/sodium antiporter [Rhodospirillaceae bacterium]MCA8932329.1 calcium/sodium antiporter [Rhodospirillaceae bacterium]
MIELAGIDALFLASAAIILGIVLLVKGGDWTINGAVYVSERLGVPHMVIGFTVVAFGTSLPELFVSVNANLTGFPGISLGNVVGSNIANILLVIGVTALIATVHASAKDTLRDMVVMLLSTALLVGLMFYGFVDRWVGAVMFGALVAYVFYQYLLARRGRLEVEEVEEPEFSSMGLALLFLLLGLVLVTVGSEVLVRGAVLGATVLGVPEAVIGVTIIAFGTSLPELATCIAAAAKRHTDIIVGNIVGSNVFNILSIIGITALVEPLHVDPSLGGIDMWVMVGSSVLFALWLLRIGPITRLVGAVCVVAYCAFVVSQFGDVLSEWLFGGSAAAATSG